ARAGERERRGAERRSAAADRNDHGQRRSELADLDDAPLISRNFLELTLLIPGVTTTDPASFNTGSRADNAGRIFVNGNREQANNFMLDGADANQVSDNLAAYQPSPDAIQEMRVITQNASAEFGNFQGGVIN